MKITINKEGTTLAQVEHVKEAMKEFKARYTDSDLRRVMNDHCEKLGLWEAASTLSGDILRCDVDAFPDGCFCSDPVHYAVEIVIARYGHGYTFLRFYVDQDLTLDERPDLITFWTYEEPHKYF